MNEDTLTDFIGFLEEAPTAWHAVAVMRKRLLGAGFQELLEGDEWVLPPGTPAFVTRGGTSMCAFVTPMKSPTHAHILAAHTDSPALKLKPHASYVKEGMQMLGVEVYGGPLLNSWLNRDLAIAGHIHTANGSDVTEHLVHLKTHPVVIPQLAIHLDREVSTAGLKLNKQKHLAALASIGESEGDYLLSLIREQVPCDTLLGSDLFLVPLEPPRRIGRNGELISGYRIDNLGSTHAALTALIESKAPSTDGLNMAIFWDHEEVGSNTAQGAGSPFLTDVLERILIASKVGREGYLRMLSQSFCISVDSAHALHPNYVSSHEPHHQPRLGGGVTLKVNAQQRYATNGRAAARLESTCQRLNLPLQKFVARTDMPCGSTIGPISSTRTGIQTVDIGYPQLSMHAIRELAAANDHLAMCKLLTGVLRE
jgi:aspartyl aminopeptidase